MKDKIIAAFTLGLTVAAACYVLNVGSCRGMDSDVRVLVAAEYLPPGAILTADKLAIQFMPRRFMQFGAFEVRDQEDMQAPLGRVAVVRIPKGDQVTENCLSEPRREVLSNAIVR